MGKPAINASYDFIFAKLHGIWANAAQGDRLAKLLNSESEEMFVRQLSDYQLDGSDRSAFQKSLRNRENDLLLKMSCQVDPCAQQYYLAFVRRSSFEKLKALLHVYFFPEHEHRSMYFDVEMPWFDDVDLQLLKEASSVDDVIRMLHVDLYPSEIRRIIESVESDHDSMKMECSLDKLANRNILEKASEMPPVMRAAAEDLVKIENDIIDISAMLRMIKTYQLDAEKMKAVWLPGGHMSEEELTRLASSSSVPAAIRLLPFAYRSVLEPMADCELYICENALWRFLYRKAKAYFRDFNHLWLSIVAFPILLRMEALNLSRIYEGFHFGLSGREMQDMMIG